jgi:hypothetical protein
MIYDLSPLCFHCLEREIHSHVCFGGHFLLHVGEIPLEILITVQKQHMKHDKIKQNIGDSTYIH